MLKVNKALSLKVTRIASDYWTSISSNCNLATPSPLEQQRDLCRFAFVICTVQSLENDTNGSKPLKSEYNSMY